MPRPTANDPETLVLLVNLLADQGLIVVAVDTARGTVTVAAPETRSLTSND
jgi:hypothetical protein